LNFPYPREKSSKNFSFNRYTYARALAYAEEKREVDLFHMEDEVVRCQRKEFVDEIIEGAAIKIRGKKSG